MPQYIPSDLLSELSLFCIFQLTSIQKRTKLTSQNLCVYATLSQCVCVYEHTDFTFYCMFVELLLMLFYVLRTNWGNKNNRCCLFSHQHSTTLLLRQLKIRFSISAYICSSVKHRRPTKENALREINYDLFKTAGNVCTVQIRTNAKSRES